MECRILEKKQCEISQGFSSTHYAVDIVGGGHTIDNVLAHSDGKVIWLQTGQVNNQGSKGNASYGNCVKIQHANGYCTLYAHLETVNVSMGQHVTKGQVIGLMGNTGNSYGTHTHFEVRTPSNVRINPIEYLNKDLPSSNKECTGKIIYQACTNAWLPEVNSHDVDNNTSNSYAGILGQPITGFRCKPTYGEIIYEAHEKNGNWIGAVNSKDYSAGNGNSYAGFIGKQIDGIRIKSTKGYVDYRVHTIEDGWLSWAKGFGDSGNEYAGIYGHTIDAIQMK